MAKLKEGFELKSKECTAATSALTAREQELTTLKTRFEDQTVDLTTATASLAAREQETVYTCIYV